MTDFLNPAELKWLLIDNVKRYSENAVYLGGHNPYEFTINGKRVDIYIRNIGDSGTGRGNPDESRIQISMSDNFSEAIESKLPILFLGYDANNHVFAAWDPEHQRPRLNQKQNISRYSRFSSQVRAAQQGAAIYEDKDGQRVICFQPEYLGLYIDNYRPLHMSSEDALLTLIAKSNKIPETGSGAGDTIEIERKKYTVNHTAYPRDYNFTKSIREMYCDSCAICGMQLGLVEAAHIIPHGHPRGSDDITNGLCLCILHHGAFDGGLIYLDPDYSVQKNNEKLNYLFKVNQYAGQERVFNGIYHHANLPRLKVNYPSPEKILIGNQVRGILVG